MSFFSQNSAWASPIFAEDDESITPVASASVSTESPITNQQLEDWSHRLQSMAYEAGDEHLATLESDLLDLRDEIVFELHRRI